MSVTTTERNFNYFTYASDDGRSYNVKGDQAWGGAAASGGTAAGANAVYGRQTRRRRLRKVIFRDPNSFRTITLTVYTAAAYNAINVGATTITRALKGASTGVVFTAVKKIPELIPTSTVGRQDLQDTLAA